MAVNRRPPSCLNIKWLQSGDTESTISFSYGFTSKSKRHCLVNKTAMGFRVWKPSANSGLCFSSGFLLCICLFCHFKSHHSLHALWNMPTLKQNCSLCLESPLLLQSLKQHRTLFWNDLFIIIIFMNATFTRNIQRPADLPPHFLSLLWNLDKAQDRQTHRQKKLLCQRSALKGAYLGGCIL